MYARKQRLQLCVLCGLYTITVLILTALRKHGSRGVNKGNVSCQLLYGGDGRHQVEEGQAKLSKLASPPQQPAVWKSKRAVEDQARRGQERGGP